MPAAVVLGVIVLVGFGYGARSELLRRHRARRARPMPEPRSLVRVLTNEDELREATERAIGYEQQVARRVADRIERYRAVSPLAPVVSLVRDPDDSGTPPPDGMRDSA